MGMTSSVRVVSDYHYSTVEGQPVHLHIGDRFQLLNKTSPTWWHVQADSGQLPFYVPTHCVEEIVHSITLTARRGVSRSEPALLDRIDSFDDQAVEYYSDTTTTSDEERGECFDNPVYALPNIVLNENVDLSKGTSEDEKGSDSSYPEYVNMKHTLHSAPPFPNPNDVPVRTVEDWEEFEDALGRRYYFHPRSNASSWKPPRKVMQLHSDSNVTPNVEPIVMPVVAAETVQLRLQGDLSVNTDYQDSISNTPVNNNNIAVVESESRVTAIIYSDLPASPNPIPNGRPIGSLRRLIRPGKLAADVQGRDVEDVNAGRDLDNEKENTAESSAPKAATLPIPPKRPPPSKDFNELRQIIANKMSHTDRSIRARSVVVLNEAHLLELDKLGAKPGAIRNSRTLPTMILGKTWKSDKGGILQGFLNVTKFSENGRRVKKQWLPAFVVLMDNSLVVFRPPFALDQSPEINMDLHGATIKWSKEKSHRKNVFEVAASDGSQILLQDDNKATCQDWVNCIVQTLARLPAGSDEFVPVRVLPAQTDQTSSKVERPLSPRIARILSRTRSTKTRPDGFPPPSQEELDLPAAVSAVVKKKKLPTEEIAVSDIKVKKLKIIERLKNFFSRRPTLESLKAKGIIRDGPVFGCNFLKLCEHEQSNVPAFVKRCVTAIEKKDLCTDGIYRVSGNLSQVQKLRFQIDQDKYNGMESEEDVNVLTGLLKLFFRELKEPMVPFNLYDPLMKANKIPDKSLREKKFKDLVNQIPGPNCETLRYLFQHLHRVSQYGDHNRMKLGNLAIVFGPTLMWPETPSMNLATDMLCQNQVVEHLLLNFYTLFESSSSGIS
ncbi:rho GTPase-activating protein 15-like [Paramacrobiotus metropolitanus]|uniref:rho GTPase-activating protein 15-like n=1 Tax=Paramacrobiotus metropolitanus TaxID=2943436 RepID=UPI0024460AEE|nr:rho GTPase-activating protein 15-like [Paramacrobiotus metropolitanus]XP_055352707.1 rho GTPase-activating protein 15-like [Paramacrobiotus metropolitanus]